jgi:two-component sensor histidine kinase
MMILSLLKLQISRSNLREIKDSLKVTENRIKSIANLYEMLLLNNEDININTEHYLKKIYTNIAMNFQKEIEIEYDITHNIELDSLIYVGLVFNELVTNSFKYAFPDNTGKIFLTLKEEDNKIFLSIKDNGQGFKERRKNSLGLTIVETLIEGQLLGELTINSEDSTEVFMSWKV